MSKILKPENMTRIAIDPRCILPGTMVSISSNVTEDKTYCVVESVCSNKISFMKYVNGIRWHVDLEPDDIIEYDLRIEVM